MPGPRRQSSLVVDSAHAFLAANFRFVRPRELSSFGAILPGALCGCQLSPVCAGEQDSMLFRRFLPWDHAPGTLFLKDARGCVARFDGPSYRPADHCLRLLPVRNREL